MSKRFDSFIRKAATFAGAGLLLQTGGCDLQGAIGDIVSTAAAGVINSFVFGLFGLV